MRNLLVLALWLLALTVVMVFFYWLAVEAMRTVMVVQMLN